MNVVNGFSNTALYGGVEANSTSVFIFGHWVLKG